VTATEPNAGKAPVSNALILRLYIAGGAPNSMAAEANLRRCLGAADGLFEIVDILIDKARALADGITVTPTLIRISPAPKALLIGSLANQETLARFVGR
jgi:circadian clock protein KaiB